MKSALLSAAEEGDYLVSDLDYVLGLFAAFDIGLSVLDRLLQVGGEGRIAALQIVDDLMQGRVSRLKVSLGRVKVATFGGGDHLAHVVHGGLHVLAHDRRAPVRFVAPAAAGRSQTGQSHQDA